MVKVTFTFDDETVATLRRTAERLRRPNSAIVREAIRDYATRSDRLSDDERRHLLKVFDRVVGRIPAGRQTDADGEIARVRAARRAGGRRTRAE